MRRLLLMLALISTLVVDVAAMRVTPEQATQFATDFINKLDGGDSPFQPNMDGVMTVYSVVDPTQPVYYIYNAKRGLGKSRFVIVAGENSVVNILAYGDGCIDVDNIPEAMTALLDYYRVQMEQLLQSSGSGNGDVWRGRPGSGSLVNTAGFSLLTTTWGQGRPYYYQCPTATNGTHCLTGCAATALAQVLNYWNAPDWLPAQNGYVANGITVEPLPGIDIDWSLMKNSYKKDADAESDSVQAVAWLMRYVGQALTMNYGLSSSSTGVTGFTDLLNSVGYNARKLSKNEVADNDVWTGMMVAELDAGRPIIYSAMREGGGGHVFDVDGYMVDDGKYKFHINWGWDGKDYNSDTTSNGFFYLDEFQGQNTMWSKSQGMVLGIDDIPALTVDQDTLLFEGYVNSVSTSHTLTVMGNAAFCYRDEPVSISIEGSDASEFAVMQTTIEAQQMDAGAPLTVTYTPTRGGDATARLVISSVVADTVIVVNLNGHAEAASPRFNVSTNALVFTEYCGCVQSQTFTVTATQLTDDIKVNTYGNSKGYITVSPTVIPRAEAMSEGGATVTVTYSPLDFDNSTVRFRLTSSGSASRQISVRNNAYYAQTMIVANDDEPVVFDDGHAGYTQSRTMDVIAQILYQKTANDSTIYSAPVKGDLSLFVCDEMGHEITTFAVTPSTITPDQAYYGTPVTVTYNPDGEGDHVGYLSVYCPEGPEGLGAWLDLYGHAISQPSIRTSLSGLDIDHGHTGYETTRRFNVSAYNLTADVHLDIEGGDGLFSISPMVIPVDSNTVDVPVTVIYSPTADGSSSATIVIASQGVDTTRLPLTAQAISTPCVETSTPVLEFDEFTGYSQTLPVEVRGYNLTGNITALMQGDDCFVGNISMILADDAQQGVPIDVTFSPRHSLIVSDKTARLVLSSPGAANDTVNLLGHYTLSDYFISTDSVVYTIGHGNMDPDTLTVTILCSLPDKDDVNPFRPRERIMSPQGMLNDNEPPSSPRLGVKTNISWAIPENLVKAGICFSLLIDGEDAADFGLCDSTAMTAFPLSTGNVFPNYYPTRLPSILNTATTQTTVTIVFNPRSTGVGERAATLHIKPEGFTAKPLSVNLIGNAGLAMPAWLRGDVNDDHVVDINDVTALIQAVLTGNYDLINMTAADANGDDEVDINDVTELIHCVLTGAWSVP